MPKDYEAELQSRVMFIKNALENSHTTALVFGNSGGKDSALVGILAKMACENTLGVIMPCSSKQNYGTDMDDGNAVARMYNIETITVDLSSVKSTLFSEITSKTSVSETASTNINPRLRMTTLYSIAQTRNALVCGTGNKSELYMGYFTKYGDGGCDINPISDLTATEIFDFLKFLNAPKSIIEKAPSAGLYEGQTDELDMGITYAELDGFLNGNNISDAARIKIENAHNKTEHKRSLPLYYK